MKKISLIFLSVLLLCALSSCLSSCLFSGGEGVTWKIDWKNNILTIEGTGDLTDTSYLDKWISCIETVKIGEGVTSLPEQAFRDCEHLKYVTLPESLTQIGDGAFYGCYRLKTITIGENVTKIGRLAFAECTALTEVDIQNDNESVTFGSEIFKNCGKLQKISLKIVGGKDAKTDFAEQIGVDESILSVTYLLDDKATKIENNQFEGVDTLTELTIPETVSVIGQYAFRDCVSLTSVTLSESVKELGNGAFSGCTALTELNIRCNLKYVKSDAFDGCNIKKVIIGGTVTKLDLIDFSAFPNLSEIVFEDGFNSLSVRLLENCNSITSVILPDSITTIPAYCFRGCQNLTSVTLPNHLTEIGNYAFADCTKLSALTGGTATEVIGSGAFQNDISLAVLPFGSNVQSLGNSVFEGCTSLTNVTFGTALTKIPEKCFCGCSALSQISLSGTMTEYGAYAFSGTSLTEYTVTNAKTLGNALFFGCEKLKKLTIKAEITSLPEGFCKNCEALTTISLPSTLTEIGDYAFENTALTEWTFTTDLSVGTGAFRNCRNLGAVSMSGQTKIGSRAFAGCKNLKSISFTQVTDIRDKAFYNCESLQTVVLDGTFLSLPEETFALCKNMTALTLPKTVTSIGVGCFLKCDNLMRLNYGGTESDYKKLVANTALWNSSFLSATVKYIIN